MSRTGSDRGSPRAIVHKRILDVADASPDASLASIADEVSGATPDLVDRVLEEYGDPAEDGELDDAQETAMKENGDQATEQPAARAVEPAALTEKKRETLRLVAEHPDWSQADIAAELGVSRATVSRRLNDVPGFEWQDRETFTSDLFDDDPATAQAGDETGSVEQDDGVGEAGAAVVPVERDDLDRIERRLADLEERVDDPAEKREPIALPPELAHKVVHACMESDRLDENEELRLIEALLRS